VTDVYGILGWPVTHSLSPAMHGAAFAALGIDAAYVAFPVSPARLPEALRGLAALGIAGVNVTLPHKETVLPLLDAVEPDARTIGAVNTIVRDGDRLIGTNTDAPGLVASLVESSVTLAGIDVVIVGAGGAARAAVVGLARAGAARIVVAARRFEQALALVADAHGTGLGAAIEAHALDRTLEGPASHARLLVQATSATLAGKPEATAFARSLPLGALPRDAVVTELVYRPRVTAVMREADRLGLRTVDGLGMLLHQGAIAFERWTERPAPLDAMRRALGVAG
jgi:shikimate dehydrogenase